METLWRGEGGESSVCVAVLILRIAYMSGVVVKQYSILMYITIQYGTLV